MRKRLVSSKYIKSAYEKKKVANKLDLREGLDIENIERIPEELFQIIGETLSFIECIDNMEGDRDEDKQ
ncbi:MAG: hypothetical protein GXY88_07825 [Tissierellia bacterium]|nr:hypothetical protein [Tissierellia bacterium]